MNNVLTWISALLLGLSLWQSWAGLTSLPGSIHRNWTFHVIKIFPLPIIHMRTRDGSVIEWYISRSSDVYPEGWGWGIKHVTPGWADDRGGGAVQKPEAFRQIWPQAKYESDWVVFYLLASEPKICLPPIMSTFSQRGAWHPLWCPEKLKLLPLISTVHFKIGIKAAVKENFILEMACRAGKPLLWACVKPNLCTEATLSKKREDVRLGAGHAFPPSLQSPNAEWHSLILSWNLHPLLWGLIHPFQTVVVAAPTLVGLHFHLLGDSETEEQNNCYSWTWQGCLCKIPIESSFNHPRAHLPFLLCLKQIILWNFIRRTFDEIYQIPMRSFKSFHFFQTIPLLH